MAGVVAVVLAGGASRRYGSDKLAADVAGAPLLDRTVAGLAPDRHVIIVGPERPIGRAVEFVADDHPGGGPAAAMITGLRAALATAAELITILPGDAPGAGAAAEALLGRLIRDPAAEGVLAVDRDGHEQPLQLALRRPAAERLIEAAGPEAGAGASARRLVRPLGLARVELAGAETWDIDTPDQHRAWAWRDSEAVRLIEAAIATEGPELVILLGPDPADVTTLAHAVTLAGAATPAPTDRGTAPAAEAFPPGWTAHTLHPSTDTPTRTRILRVALRSPHAAPAAPEGIDLRVPHPDA